MKHRLEFLPPFFRFGVVGVIAYFIDAGSMLLLLEWMSILPARLIAFTIAVTSTFFMNKWLTFEGLIDPSLVRSYLRYVSANSVGGAINLLVSTTLLFQGIPVLSLSYVALAIGSLSGLVANYTLSKRFIFLTKAKSDPKTD